VPEPGWLHEGLLWKGGLLLRVETLRKIADVQTTVCCGKKTRKE
jgi:hypothetical protein